MVDVSQVADKIYLIDDQLYSIPRLGSVYLLDEDKKALIETGPATSARVVLEGIRKLGFQPEDINYIVVTHVHLDHAGGVGVLVGDMPQAQVVVHHRGARHLIDPTKLVRGTVDVQGTVALEKNGPVIPVDEGRVRAVHDDDIIKLSDGQSLKIIDAPGHVSHELCVYESGGGGVFVGDAVGNYVAEVGVLLPVTPPPSFSLELSISTITHLMELGATTIYFSHFGASGQVQEILQLAIDKLKIQDDIMTQALKECHPERAVARIMAMAMSELESIKDEESDLYNYLTGFSVPVSVDGHLQYRQKHAGLSCQ